MKIWIATSNETELKHSFQLPIEGIITNPSVIAQRGGKWQDTVQMMDSIGHGPIHLQMLTTNFDSMQTELAEFQSLVRRKKLIAKLPISEAAIQMVKICRNIKIGVNITAACSIAQINYALEAGADFISIYVARLDDINESGLKVVEQTRTLIEQNGFSTQIMAASIRNLSQLNSIVLAGAHAIAMPYPLLLESFNHPLTDKSVAAFSRDWASVV